MDRNEFLKRKSQVVGAQTPAKQTAITGEPQEWTPQLEGKGFSWNKGQIKDNRPNDLGKALETVARLNKDFRRRITDRDLSNPTEFLRRRHPKGHAFEDQYVVTDAELEGMIQLLLSHGRGKAGTPFQEWCAGNYNGIATNLDAVACKGGFGENSQFVRKALDVTSGAPLMRTDIEPVLYEAYLRDFPAAEVIKKVPANGIVHTFNRRTAVGTASTISDLGDMSAVFDNSTISQASNSRVATIVAPRAIGLKFSYAVQQSGMDFNVAGSENLEVMGAMTALAKKNQTMLLQGNTSTASKTLDDEEGLTDANGYDGLRALLKGSTTSLTKAASDTYLDVINRAVGQLINAGAQARNLVLFASVGADYAIGQELTSFYRIDKEAPGGGFDSQLQRNGLRLLGNWQSKIQEVPAGAQSEGVGYYTLSSVTTEDIFAVDLSTVALAYLGSPSPTILELPLGFNNLLSQVYYSFMMNGLCLYIPSFNRKVRIPRVPI